MKSHQSGRQEDAHEFLRYFVDSLQTAALYQFKDRKYNKLIALLSKAGEFSNFCLFYRLDLFTKETSAISRIFGGFHKNDSKEEKLFKELLIANFFVFSNL